MDYSSSSSSSDEELFDIVANGEISRVFRNRIKPFEKYSDSEFKARYRLSKDTVGVIINLLEEDITPVTHRNFPLSAADQILLTLRIYATGSFQIVIGDDYGVHKTTVCRVVKKVSELLAALRPQFIKMPESNEEQLKVKSDFHNIGGFPNVIGCVDGSHVPILSAGGENAEIFRNRKGYFSVNVQAICDANLLIRDIDVRWPGSTHDSTMWNASLLCARFEAREFRGSYLLGDSAYACSDSMMTPLLNPNTPPENNYNRVHIQTRNCIERCFGVWKRRFACLALGMRTKLDTTLTMIIATAVLHNIAIFEKDAYDFEDIELNEEVDQNIVRDHNGGGNALRRSLIESVFTDF